MNPESKLGITITIVTVSLVLFFTIPISEPKILHTNELTDNQSKVNVLTIVARSVNVDPIMQSSIHSEETPLISKSTLEKFYVFGFLCSDKPNTSVRVSFPLMPTHEDLGVQEFSNPMKFSLTEETSDGWFCQPFATMHVMINLKFGETYYASIIAVPSQVTHLKFVNSQILASNIGDSMT